MMLVNKTMQKIESRNLAVNSMTPIKNQEKELFEGLYKNKTTWTPIERVEYECTMNNKKVILKKILKFN